jgi:uncharacterized delta-60 repeat protein
VGTFRRRKLAAAGAIALVALAAPAVAYERDTTWGGGDGIVTTDGGASTGDNFFDMEVLSDGKILAAGRTNTAAGGQDFLLVKYNANGSLDTAFGGGDGIVITDFGGASQDIAEALDVQADGKIVLAGEMTPNTVGAFSSIGVARYNSDGTLDDDSDDAGFGGDGLQVADPTGNDDFAYDVLVDGSGRVVTVGETYVPGTDEYDFLVVRLTSAGALDATFDGDGGSGNGAVTIDVGGPLGEDYALGVALFDDGDVAVAGGASTSGGGDDAVLARLNAADGALDDSFDNDGKAVTAAQNYIDALAVSPGKILGVGADDGNDWSLVRYEQADGSLDETFSGDGMETTTFPGQVSSAAEAVAIDGSRYVVAGDVSLADSGGGAIGAARYHGNGGLDSTFNGDGMMVADLAQPPGLDRVGGVGIADDGNALTDNPVLIAGDLNFGDETPTRDALLMRLAPDVTAPSSDITKPAHRKTYKPGKVRTLTGTATDPNDGSGIDRVELALRRKRSNGSCAWWDGDSFAPGDCSTRVYFDATGATDWSYTLPANLKSSVGTKTKNYTLFARAEDLADNLESASEVGRNANTFDVR